jgi:activator of the mannose operon (transcriptional antiterminator)
MSSKKEREQKLLFLLSKNRDYMTAEALADLLATSPKTIYRLIKKMNDESTIGPLVLSEKGRGYQLDYEKYMKQNYWQNHNKSPLLPAERRSRILEELLLSAPKARNVADLFEAYYVGDSVIFNDEQLMAEELKTYNLKLERKNRTLAIIGAEAQIRKAIADRLEIQNILDIDELRTNKELKFNHYDVLFLSNQLKQIEQQLNIVIPYPYNVNIFSHLYILIRRFKKVGPSFITAKKDLSASEKAELEKNQPLAKAAERTILAIQNYLNQQLPEIEKYYLYQYLVSSRIQGPVSEVAHFSTHVLQVTQFYLEEMSRRLKVPIERDALFVELANHIKPMLNRLAHKIRVKNNLLEQIKLTYDALFNQVAAVSKQVSAKYALPEINEDENGFITLYFARLLEMHQVPIRTLIMCTTGVGTSELLRVKISKKFPELEVVAVIANRNIKESLKKYSNIELILTTIHLAEQLAVKSLLVNVMFTMDDQQRLQRKIEEIYHER